MEMGKLIFVNFMLFLDFLTVNYVVLLKNVNVVVFVVVIDVYAMCLALFIIVFMDQYLMNKLMKMRRGLIVVRTHRI
jgi:hypothetical protein